jgi:hypothetical protein
LIISGQLLCPEYLYQQISRDLELIRTEHGLAHPKLNDIEVTRPFSGSLWLTADTATFAQMIAGEYHYWDRLNTLYHPRIYPRSPVTRNDVILELPSNLHPARVDEMYAQLPGVIDCWATGIAFLYSTIYARPTHKSELIEFDFETAVDSGMTYVFYAGAFDCPSGCLYNEWWLFRSDRDNNIVFEGYWYDWAPPPNPLPDWWDEALLIRDANWSWPPG